MTASSTDEAQHSDGPAHFYAALAPRLPRMIAVTIVAVFATFAAIQFIPQSYEARLDMRLPAGSKPDLEAGRIADQQHLGDIVSRLSPEIIAELRRNGGGVLDTTALLHKRLKLTPGAEGKSLTLAATAGTPARARAIVEATMASYAALSPLPVPLAETPQASSVSVPANPAPGSETSLETLQQRLSLAWEDRVKLENRARRVDDLVSSGNYAMLALDAEGLPGLGRKLDDLAALEAERERLAVNFLPNHPAMRTLNEEISGLSSDLSADMQQLAELVAADRDAARRLEDDLRDKLALASASQQADETILTGNVAATTQPDIVALPRPVRTDLALAFAGGLAFFGQVGLLALLRRRLQGPADDLIAEEPVVASPVAAREPPEPAASAVAAKSAVVSHNWLETAPATAIGASWLDSGSDSAARQPRPLNAPAPRDADLESRIGEARFIAIRTPAGWGAVSRQLLAELRRSRKRVVLVDGASRVRGRAPGLSDLSLGLATFGDVIHGSGAYETAFVPWGQQSTFNPAARSVETLLAALEELYDVVIVTLDGDNLAATAPLAAGADLVIDAEDIAALARRAA